MNAKPTIVTDNVPAELQELRRAAASLRAARGTAQGLSASPAQLPWLRQRSLRLATAVHQFLADLDDEIIRLESKKPTAL